MHFPESSTSFDRRGRSGDGLGRVEHSLASHESCRTCDVERRLEKPIGARRTPQPLTRLSPISGQAGAGGVAANFAEASSPFERALAIARPALDQLFGEWAARGHVPIVPVNQKHQVLDGTVINDLTDPDGGDRKLEGSLAFDLHLLVSDRVRERELEPLLREVPTSCGRRTRRPDG